MTFDEFLALAEKEKDNLIAFNFRRELKFAKGCEEREQVLELFKVFLQGCSTAGGSAGEILNQFVFEQIEKKFANHPGLKGPRVEKEFPKSESVFLRTLYNKDNLEFPVLRLLKPEAAIEDLKALMLLVIDFVQLTCKESGVGITHGEPANDTKIKINERIESLLEKEKDSEVNFDKDKRRAPSTHAQGRKRRNPMPSIVNDSIWWQTTLEAANSLKVPPDSANDHVVKYKALLGIYSDYDSIPDNSYLQNEDPLGRVLVHFSIDESEEPFSKTQPNPFSGGDPKLWLAGKTRQGRTVQLGDSFCAEKGENQHSGCDCGAVGLPEAVSNYRELSERPRKTHQITVAYLFQSDLKRFEVPEVEVIKRKAG